MQSKKRKKKRRKKKENKEKSRKQKKEINNSLCPTCLTLLCNNQCKNM